MIKHHNKYFDETYYNEKLNNGLQVIIFYKPEFNTTVCAFGTPYGALKINEKYKKKEYHFNPGVAHFLEHKLFEAKGDDMTNTFSSMGANVNAFTSYNETVYYFSKTGKDIDAPLNLLLDFVQELNITSESVEKEKGIIAQEVSMYMQMPDQKLLNETYKCLYKNFPIKYDIGGDLKSINKITLNELEKCYQINYHPSNMVLCITSPIDPKKIIKIVKDNQNKKHFVNEETPKVCNKKEPTCVVKARHIFKMPINTSKHIYAIKVKPNFKDCNDAFRKEWALRILLEIYFSPINPKYQKWLDQKIINDYFGYETDFNMDYANLVFYIENDDSRVLKKILKHIFDEDLVNEENLKQIKHRYIGVMFDIFNDIESFNLGYIRDYLAGLDFFKALDDLSSITIEEVRKAKAYLDNTNYSYITMRKK